MLTETKVNHINQFDHSELEQQIKQLQQNLNTATEDNGDLFAANLELRKEIEELKKLKYACPNCHGIVDELIKSNELGASLLPFLPSYYCKYCIEDKT